MAESAPVTVGGSCDPRFAAVRREFERNFAERGEVGASVSVTLEGETVVDLWGGVADPARRRPWVEDTICVVWSCTKGATALCAHMLASRGELELDAPMTRYWPEFGRAGKENVTVRMALGHQSAVPAVREPLPEGAFNDWERMTAVLAAETPFWEPGTRNGYHAFTFGWLVGEVVRRVAGRSLGTFFREEVATPLGLDFWIGLPEEHERRVAPIIMAPPPAPGEPVNRFMTLMLTEPTSIPGLLFLNTGGHTAPGGCDTRAAHAAELPAVGGVTNGRGLARMYAPLSLGGQPLLDEGSVRRMGAVFSATSVDAALLVPTRFSAGFSKGIDNRHLPTGHQDSVLLSEAAFGHPGVGGSIGFADPAARMSFGYAMNQLGAGMGLNDRGQSLIDATYRSLGCRTNAYGSWG